MYLLDTNILLEVLLEQDRAEEVEKFMNNTNEGLLHLSELTLYSIGIKLNLKKKEDVFLKFIDDLFIRGNLKLINLNPIDMQSVVQNNKSYNLDFDDAYQLSCTRKYNLKLVSFDNDFDRTPTKRLEPRDLLG